MAEVITWFDNRTAELLVGEAAVAGRLPESGPGDVVPLVDALHSDLPSVDRHDKLNVDDWEREDYLAFGHWTMNILRQADPNVGLLRDDLVRFNELGLGPHYVRIVSRFGSIWQYREALGINPQKSKGRFDSWSQDDFIKYARTVAETIPDGTRPTAADYTRCHHEHFGPPVHTILSRLGGVSKLNELIGFPNIHDWDHDDYIEWGVKAVRANDGLIPTSRMMNAISKRKRGPSARSVAEHLGSVDKFQRLVAEEFQRQNEERREREARLEELWSGELRPLTTDEEKILPDEDKFALTGRYEIARLALGGAARADGLMDLARLRPAEMGAALRRHKPRISDAELETVAMTHGLLDYLVPPDTSWMSYLAVAEDEVPFTRPGNQRRSQRLS